MKYKLECNGEKVTETLELNGKEYRRTWNDRGNGFAECGFNDCFTNMLERDGVVNNEILYEVYDKLDTTAFSSHVLDVCRMIGGDVE